MALYLDYNAVILTTSLNLNSLELDFISSFIDFISCFLGFIFFILFNDFYCFDYPEIIHKFVA